MLRFLLLASSLLCGFAHAEVDSTLRPIRGEKCETSLSEARTVVEARLADGDKLCGKGNSAKQVGGWSCKHSGCAKDQYRCVTQYSCVEGSLTLSIPGKAMPSGTPAPDAAAGPRAEPRAIPNSKNDGKTPPAGAKLPEAQRRHIQNGNQVFVEEKGVDANGVPSAKVYDQKKGAPNDLKVYGSPVPSAIPAGPAPSVGPAPTAAPAGPSPAAPAAAETAPKPTVVDKAAEAATTPATEALQKQSEALKELDKE